MRAAFPKSHIFSFLVFAIVICGPSSLASDNHDHEKHDEKHEHDKEEKRKDEKHKDAGGEHSAKASQPKENSEKEKHDDHDEEHGDHEEEAEGASVVGADKGIQAASAEDGIKLAPEAVKNFKLQMLSLAGSGPWSLPNASLVYSAREVNLFRFRNGFFKRIDFKILSKTPTSIRIESKDLKSGDSVVVNGLGFLRVAEIAAFGGAPEGHSH